MQREADEDEPQGDTHPVVARIVKGRDMMYYATIRMSFDSTTSTLAEVPS